MDALDENDKLMEPVSDSDKLDVGSKIQAELGLIEAALYDASATVFIDVDGHREIELVCHAANVRNQSGTRKSGPSNMR